MQRRPYSTTVHQGDSGRTISVPSDVSMATARLLVDSAMNRILKNCGYSLEEFDLRGKVRA